MTESNNERTAGRLLTLLHRPWLRVLAVLVALGVALWSVQRVPNASWVPALVGVLPWAVGKYVLCPLRWHALSTAGRTRRWHMRVYAESELLGLASPAHVGADLWRMRRLQVEAGMAGPCAVAEVALDRLIGALGLALFVVLAGATLPLRVVLAATAIALVLGLLAFLLRRRRPDLLAGRPLPPWPVVLRGTALSVGYQLTIVALLMGTVAAMGAHLHPVALLGVFGVSQVAGIVPGVHGASPREGALVVGLAALGLSWQAAVGAVALTALLAWAPALLFGGAGLLARRVSTYRSARLALS